MGYQCFTRLGIAVIADIARDRKNQNHTADKTDYTDFNGGFAFPMSAMTCDVGDVGDP
jgi:hypothetical protein